MKNSKINTLKKKIVFLSPTDKNLYLFRLPVMRRLVDLGWNVVAIAPKGRYSDRFKKFGINFIPYTISRRTINPINEIKTLAQLIKILKSEKPNILHTFTHKPNIYGNAAGKLADIPIIVNSMTGLGSIFIEDNLKSNLAQAVIEVSYKTTSRFSKRVTFLNNDDRKTFIEKGLVKEEKTALIRGSGIDTKEWDISKVKFHKDSKLRILMVSRIIKHKGVMEYIESAAILNSKYPGKLQFVLVGDHDSGNPSNIHKEAISNAVKEKDIKFLGWKENVKEIMASCDICVLPSYGEGLPVTLQEALSLSKPIVATNISGCKEAVDNNKNGFLVPVKNVGKLAEAIERLVLDRSLRNKFGEYSRNKAIKEFDIRLVVNKYLDIYEGLLGKIEHV